MKWRRRFSRFLSVTACCIYAWQSFASSETVIKHRAVVNEKEPDLPNKTVATIKSYDARSVLRLICIPEKGLSAKVEFTVPQKLADTNSAVRLSYQADENSVSEDKAWPTGRSGFILPNARQILEDATSASALHIQIYIANDPTASMVFRPKDVSRVIQNIKTDCPSDAPPPDQNGLAK